VNQVSRVVDALSAQGRDVTAEVIERQLGGLQGLPPDVAAEVLLRTYGLAPDGTALPGFKPDRSGREVLFNIFRETWPSSSYLLVASIVGLLPAIAVPLLIRLFVDRFIVGLDATWGLVTVAGILVAATIAAVAVYLQQVVLGRIRVGMTRSGTLDFAWSMLTMKVPVLQNMGAGEMSGRYKAVNRFALHSGLLFPLQLVTAVTSITFLLMIFVLDLIMGVVAVLIVIVLIFVVKRVLQRRSFEQNRYDVESVKLNSYTSDVISSAESIKAAAWEQFAFSRWSVIRQRYATSLSSLGIAHQYTTTVPVLGQSLGLGAFLAIGVAQVFAGTVSLGTVVAAQAYMVSLLIGFSSLSLLAITIQAITSSAQQFGPVLNEPLDPEMLTVTEPNNTPAQRLSGDVSLHEVNFGYGDTPNPLLRDLTLTVGAGRRVALVGPSGSGKTTIAKLMIGELRPWSGYVSLDGVPRLSVPRERRTRDIAYVPQTAALFPGTIRDNLTLWNNDITDEDLGRAARDACIEDTILGRPGAYFHRVVSADGGFSGGELQRLSIARALAGDPRIIVLDEATSALDPIIEALVEANLRQRGVTAIVVAHRLSTIRDADEILVVDKGQIAQRGTYAEISHEGLFAELVHG
jgi:ABC-type bacteriocin/lantibiotic exporter with double-glycine peptidase domain